MVGGPLRPHENRSGTHSGNFTTRWQRLACRTAIRSALGTDCLIPSVTDLKTRAIASKAVAFVGDESSCKTFASISGAVGVPAARIIQARSDDSVVSAPNVDLLARVAKVPVGTRWTKTKHSRDDIAVLCMHFRHEARFWGTDYSGPSQTSRAERRACQRWSGFTGFTVIQERKS